MEMQDDFVSRTIKTQKLFNFIPGHCYYANIQVTRKNQKNDQDSKIKITNNICKQTNNNLIKVTQVKFGNRVIYIEDSYCFRLQYQNTNLSQNHRENSNLGKFISPPTTSSDGSQNNNQTHHNTSSKIMLPKKKLIFKKKNIGENRQEKRNTKNIAKNFSKAFVLYLEEKKQSSLIANKMKHLIDSYNFNNKIIQKMVTDPQIKQNFKIFLQEKAELWINSSKIHDKQIHIEAIKIYLQLIQNGIYSSQSLSNSDSKSIYDSDSQYKRSDSVINHQNSSKK